MATLKVPVTSKDHIQGDEQAAITLVEYGDYQCPHCGHAHPIVQRIQKHFGKQLRFVFRNFPLNEIHPQAEIAAESTEFAATQDHFWEMHDGIFENQEDLSLPFLLQLAEELKLSSGDLEQALAREQFAARVKEDFLGGVRSGVNGTPTFFINGQRHDAAPEALTAAIESQLK
jgi:protein-disulfide isomerase